ncbi:hypothetical protein NRB_28420 [Novosphingobium sp. 11B]
MAAFAESAAQPVVDLVDDLGNAIGITMWGNHMAAAPAPSASFENGMVYILDTVVENQPRNRHLCPYEALTDVASLTRHPVPLEVSSAACDHKITLSFGQRRTTASGKWKATTGSFAVFASQLEQHTVGEKDGRCFLQGEAAGGSRKASAMIANYVLGVDIDDGTPIEEVTATIAASGLEAVIYTTHSHLKNTTLIGRDHYMKESGESDPTPDGVRSYLQQQKAMRPELLQEITIIDELRHTEDGVMIAVGHSPIPKCRVVFPLSEPFVFAKRGGTQSDGIAEWKERYAGFCTALGLTFDKACVDPARLFYMPRHPKHLTEFETIRVVGAALDLDRYPRTKLRRQRGIANSETNVFAAAGEGEAASLTFPSGKSMKAWAARNASRFEIESLLSERLDDEQLRDARSGGKPGIHIGCPFEDEHSSYGGTGTYIVNASDMHDEGGNGFSFHCSHNACMGRDRLDLLHGLISQGLIDEADLTNPEYLIELEDDDEDDEDAENGGGESGELIGNDDEAFAGCSADEVKHLKELNAMYAVVTVGSSVRIMYEPREPHLMPIFLTRRDMLTREENRVVLVEHNGKAKQSRMAQMWLGWEARRTYDHVVFAPGQSRPRTYNLFKDWSRKPRKGEWGRLKRHLKQVICRDNEELFTWLMTWLAHIFQRPQEKPGVAVVIRGEKGTGKSIIFDFLKPLMEPYFFRDANGGRVLGKFNAQFQRTLLLVMEEAFWAGSKQQESVLKDLITSSALSIERKGVDATMEPNYMRLALISNEPWVIPATSDERRYAMFDCSSEFRGDKEYFQSMADEMNSGGAEAMLFDLLNFVPENGWTVLRTAPRTSALQGQVVESLHGIDRFMFDLLSDGLYECEVMDGAGIYLSEQREVAYSLTDLRMAIKDYLANHHPNDRKLTFDLIQRAFIEWFGGRVEKRPVNDNMARWAVFPPLASAREHVRKLKGIEVAVSSVEPSPPMMSAVSKARRRSFTREAPVLH